MLRPPDQFTRPRAPRVVKYLRSAPLFGFFALLMRATAAFAVNSAPVQLFYVPFPEDQLLQGLQSINSADPVDPVTDYISIAAVANGTIIYYDQWENGYDTDIANPTDLYSSPGNLDGTQIWGDGNVANRFAGAQRLAPAPRGARRAGCGTYASACR